MIERKRTLARLRFSNRDARSLDEVSKSRGRLAIDHSAAGNYQRFLSRADALRRSLKQCAIGQRTRDVPHTLLKQLLGVIPRLSLHVLRQCQRNSTGFGGRTQNAHCFHQSEWKLIGPVDAIPVTRNGLECVVDRDVLRMFGLELLEHWSYVAARENIAGQKQHRNSVDCGSGCAGDHVCSSGSD